MFRSRKRATSAEEDGRDAGAQGQGPLDGLGHDVSTDILHLRGAIGASERPVLAIEPELVEELSRTFREHSAVCIRGLLRNPRDGGRDPR